MFIYSIYGYEENTVLQHEKEFTREEFNKICKEAPLFISDFGKDYSSSNIIEYLINNYGFKEATYTAGFWVDGEIEE
jgi:hypothetical protein